MPTARCKGSQLLLVPTWHQFTETWKSRPLGPCEIVEEHTPRKPQSFQLRLGCIEGRACCADCSHHAWQNVQLLLKLLLEIFWFSRFLRENKSWSCSLPSEWMLCSVDSPNQQLIKVEEEWRKFFKKATGSRIFTRKMSPNCGKPNDSPTKWLRIWGGNQNSMTCFGGGLGSLIFTHNMDENSLNSRPASCTYRMASGRLWTAARATSETAKQSGNGSISTRKKFAAMLWGPPLTWSLWICELQVSNLFNFH